MRGSIVSYTGRRATQVSICEQVPAVENSEKEFSVVVLDIERELLQHVSAADRGAVRALLRQIYDFAEQRSDMCMGLHTSNRRLKQQLKSAENELDREVSKVKHYDTLMDFMKGRLRRRDARSTHERRSLMKEMLLLRDQLFRVTELQETSKEHGVAFPLNLEDLTCEENQEDVLEERDMENMTIERMNAEHTAQIRIMQLQLDEEMLHRERMLKDAEQRLRQQEARGKKALEALDELRIASVEETENTCKLRMEQLQSRLNTALEEGAEEAEEADQLEEKLIDSAAALKRVQEQMAAVQQNRDLLKSTVQSIQNAVDSVLCNKNADPKVSELCKKLDSYMRNSTEGNPAQLRLDTQLPDSPFGSTFPSPKAQHPTSPDSPRREIDAMDKKCSFQSMNVDAIKRIHSNLQTHLVQDHTRSRKAAMHATLMHCFVLAKEIGRRAKQHGEAVTDKFLASQDWNAPSGTSRAAYISWLQVLVYRRRRDTILRQREGNAGAVLQEISESMNRPEPKAKRKHSTQKKRVSKTLSR